jgi:hypothetical protein
MKISTRRPFLARLDPFLVLRLMDDDMSPGDKLAPYDALYKELRDAYLKELGDPTVTGRHGTRPSPTRATQR